MSPTAIPGNLILQSPTANDPLLDLNTQPSLDLQFATSKTLNDRVSGQNLITFSRSTTGTYVDSNGIIQTAAIDAPRFDHDPTTGESLGLLIEESRTNLLTYSEEFDNPIWNGTITPNTAIAPDGTLTAYTLEFPSQFSALFYTNSNLVTTPGTQVTISCYIKNIDGNSQLALKGSASGAVYLELINITSEWQRYSATFTHNGTNDIGFLLQDRNVSGLGSIHVWGAQVEVGAFPTSYIPTSGSTGPRAADVASITGSNFSRWYNQSSGTVFCDFSPERTTNGTRWAAQFGNVTTVGPNAFVVGKIATSFLYAETRVSSVTQYSVSQAMTSNKGKIAYAVANGDHQAAFDGTLASSGTGTFASLSNTILHIGKNVAATEILNGHLSRLTYYPYRLPDATLQEITS